MNPKSVEYFREEDNVSLALVVNPKLVPRKDDTIIISGLPFAVDEIIWNLNSEKISVILRRA